MSVTTLDRLIEHYGVPVYCKVDVEGFESEVIAGLSRALPLLSFEFHSEVLGNVDRIVARLRRLGWYDFNYSLGEWPGLDRAGWIGAHALLEALGELGDEAWGNLFAVQRH